MKNSHHYEENPSGRDGQAYQKLEMMSRKMKN